MTLTHVLAALRYPANYELGGAVWRFYVAEKNGTVDVVDRRLIAVPFYESLSSNGKREITCHGPKGIYGSFIDDRSFGSA
jgi:hypothetical protein